MTGSLNITQRRRDTFVQVFYYVLTQRRPWPVCALGCDEDDEQQLGSEIRQAHRATTTTTTWRLAQRRRQKQRQQHAGIAMRIVRAIMRESCACACVVRVSLYYFRNAHRTHLSHTVQVRSSVFAYFGGSQISTQSFTLVRARARVCAQIA